MKKLQLFRAVFACAILIAFTSSKAALITSTSGGASVIDWGSGSGLPLLMWISTTSMVVR